jgi:hypothetical protein
MMNNDTNPHEVMRETFRWAPVFAVVGVVVIIALIPTLLIGWKVGGWFQKANIQRGYSNTVNSQQYQQSLINEMQQHLNNIQGTAVTRRQTPASSGEQQVLRSQQMSELREFCTEAQNFVPQAGTVGSMSMQTIIANNCLASSGTPAINPPLTAPIPKG